MKKVKAITADQKKSLIEKLETHWHKHGDATTYKGIRMAIRVIKGLKP